EPLEADLAPTGRPAYAEDSPPQGGWRGEESRPEFQSPGDAADGEGEFDDEGEDEEESSTEFAGTSVELTEFGGEQKKRKRRRKKKKRGDGFGAAAPAQGSVSGIQGGGHSSPPEFAAETARREEPRREERREDRRDERR